MKNLFLLLAIVSLMGCREKSKENAATQEAKGVPVYKVDLDRLDSVSLFDLFSKVEIIPLETNEKTRLQSAEFGIHKNRFLIFDKQQGLCFGFDMEGRFKYVTENKARVVRHLLPDGSVPVDANAALSYYYDLQWFQYLTYRNGVYRLDSEGHRVLRYRWDFGKYNQEKISVPNFPIPSKVQLALFQKDWMQDSLFYALSEAKENTPYIYVLVDRIFARSGIFDKSQLTHLFWHKPSGTHLLLQDFAEGVGLSPVTRMNDTCLLAMVTYQERDRYVKPEFLDAKNLQRFKQMKPNDNPLIIRYVFKKKD